MWLSIVLFFFFFVLMSLFPGLSGVLLELHLCHSLFSPPDCLAET